MRRPPVSGVCLVFLGLAGFDAVAASRAIGAFAAHGGGQLGLLALHAILRTAIALAFAFFTAQRPEPRRRARQPVALLACAVAMLAVVPAGDPTHGTSSLLLLAGDGIAAAATAWILASVLTLGRCFGVLPEARGLVTRGPYSLVRHPVYLGEIGAMAGLTLAVPAFVHLATFGVFVIAQSARMGLEERALSEAFPEYEAYAARIPRLVPAPRVALGLAVAALAVLAVTVVPAQAGAVHHSRGRHPRASVIARLRAPALQSPSNGVSVESLPAFEWKAVAHAASYQFELAADPRFASLVRRTLSGQGSLKSYNTAATLDKTVPDGTYYWRVRALSAKDKSGPWSPTRRVVKAWSAAPRILGGDGLAVAWPAAPLVLRWSSVPYATKYLVSVATDPALSNLVVGSATQPTETQGTSFVVPISLAPGSYYWAITPLDAEGHRGVRSRVASFQWTWPTSTATSLTDLNPDARVFDPMFSWNPVPGAARYEVEVNSAEGFPAGSKWCCAGTTTGTSLAPLQVLANNTYYWRVRAIDARGNAGVWNYGQPFTKAFDSVTPSIPNLTVRDIEGNALSGAPSTDVPIVTWDPVPGASRYEVQLGEYNSLGHYCDWTLASAAGYHADTATTAWTPLASTISKPFPEGWPAPQQSGMLSTGPGGTYCVRVLARSDDDAQHGQVTSEWTYLNGYDNPAFTFTEPPAGSACASTPASAYRLPANGALTPRTPYFTWEPVAGAGGYYVVIARDPGFTQVVDVGFTEVNAYAPRLAKGTPLSDETTAYYWAVVPVESANGEGVCSDPAHDNPQSFDKSSVPPEPISPADGAGVSSQPTFRWTAAENARDYQLQVSRDPTFGNPIDDVTTDATAYTSSSTYPADTVVYWRVRANDWNGQGLNWSPVRTFVRRLPVPSPTVGESGGPSIPTLSWTPVQDAIAYDLHLEQPDGTTKDFTLESPAATVVKYYGTGIWRWQVRAEFPTGLGGKVAGGYSAAQPYLLTLGAPNGAYGVKTGGRLLISWNPDPAAKQYEVEVSPTDGFSTTVDTHRTDNTSWAPFNVNLSSARNRGRLYWRVAAIDQGGNVGAFATGSFGKAPAAPRHKCVAVGHKAKRHKALVKCASHKRKSKHKRKGH